MSLFRARIALRPVLRAPAPTLTRGLRNYDVNTPSETVADKLQGSEAPSIYNEQEVRKDGKTVKTGAELESQEDQAFARAEANAMKDKYNPSEDGKINEKDVDLGVNRNADKVSYCVSTPGLLSPLSWYGVPLLHFHSWSESLVGSGGEVNGHETEPAVRRKQNVLTPAGLQRARKPQHRVNRWYFRRS